MNSGSRRDRCEADRRGLELRSVLQCSQPNYLHILSEKNTVYSILRPVASEFCIPITSGRGFSSHVPIHEFAQAFLVVAFLPEAFAVRFGLAVLRVVSLVVVFSVVAFLAMVFRFRKV